MHCCSNPSALHHIETNVPDNPTSISSSTTTQPINIHRSELGSPAVHAGIHFTPTYAFWLNQVDPLWFLRNAQTHARCWLRDGDLPVIAGDGTSKSAASRRFIALSAEMTRPNGCPAKLWARRFPVRANLVTYDASTRSRYRGLHSSGLNHPAVGSGTAKPEGRIPLSGIARGRRDWPTDGVEDYYCFLGGALAERGVELRPRRCARNRRRSRGRIDVGGPLRRANPNTFGVTSITDLDPPGHVFIDAQPSRELLNCPVARQFSRRSDITVLNPPPDRDLPGPALSSRGIPRLLAARVRLCRTDCGTTRW